MKYNASPRPEQATAPKRPLRSLNIRPGISRKVVPLILVLAILLSANLAAQSWDFQRQIDPFLIVDENGQTFALPLTGGMSRPVHQFVDIDDDGDFDLFVQDRASLLTFFRNIGSTTTCQFEWVTDQYQNLVVGEWFKFADIDSDGDYDFMAENFPGAIRYYRNIGAPGAADFVIATDSLRDEAGNFISVDPLSIPEWADIDCDNDLDLFLGRLTGEITLYRLTGLDGAGLPRYQFVSDRWEDIVILTGGKRSPKEEENRHGANSLTFVDLDGDTDNDLIWGDFFALSMIHMVNNGNCQTADFDPNNIIQEYPPNNPILTGGYNVPRFADIDGDSDLDMFVGVLGGQGSFLADLADNFYYYRNEGSPTAPNFVLQTRQFVSSIDIGRNTQAALVDIDGDLDLDLFLANEEDLSAPDRSNSRIYFFENQGSPTQPEFHLITRNYLEYDKRFDLNYSPAFADIDGDQDLDLILGKWNGKFTFYRNDGSAQQPQFTRIDENYFGLDVGNNSHPALADLDGDNDLDMLVGEANGNLNFIRNDGAVSVPDFVLVDQNYAGIQVERYSAPILFDIDSDGDVDLFLGSDTSGVLFYRNTGNPQSPQFTLETGFQLPLHLRSDPFFADIDSDGDPDFFAGVSGGGIVFYQNRELTGIADRDGETPAFPVAIRLLSNYPNPFNGTTLIEFELETSSQLSRSGYSLTLYNTLGQQVRRWNFSGNPGVQRRVVRWDGRDSQNRPAPSGIYFYRLHLPGIASQSAKMLLAR